MPTTTSTTTTPTQLTASDFVAIITEGRDLDSYIRECLTAVGPVNERDDEAMDRDGLYGAVIGQCGSDQMNRAVEATDLTLSDTYHARNEAKRIVLDRAVVIAAEMGC